MDNVRWSSLYYQKLKLTQKDPVSSVMKLRRSAEVIQFGIPSIDVCNLIWTHNYALVTYLGYNFTYNTIGETIYLFLQSTPWNSRIFEHACNTRYTYNLIYLWGF